MKDLARLGFVEVNIATRKIECPSSGVYLIALDGRAGYVGRSAYLRQRLVSHRLFHCLEIKVFKGMHFSEMNVFAKPIDAYGGAINRCEMDMIFHFKPLLNIVGLTPEYREMVAKREQAKARKANA